MRVVDEVVLDALEAAGVTVYDGQSLVDAETNTVTYPVPFAVYYSNVGDDANRRVGGGMSRRSVFFQVTFVGEDRTQAKWCGEKIRTALAEKRLTIPGYKSGLVVLDESQRVRRDDDAVRPDGTPLFYGVDQYSVAVSLIH